MDIKKLAQDIGLTENEALLYEKLLVKGRSAVASIVPLVHLTRPNVYYTLGLLEEKGLVLKTSGKKAQYEAAPPRRLLEIATERREDAKEAEERISGALEYLSKAYTLTTEKPAVWHAVGVSGLRSVYEEIAMSGEQEFLIFASHWDREAPELSALIDEQIEKQFRLNIRSRALVAKTPDIINPQWQRSLGKKGVRVRMCSSALTLPAQILVWGSTIAITTFQSELITLVIRHADVATTHRVLFEEMWKKAEEGGE